MGFYSELFILMSSLDTIDPDLDEENEIKTRDDLYVCIAGIVAFVVINKTIKLLRA